MKLPIPKWRPFLWLAMFISTVFGCGLNAQTFALPFDLNESSPAVDFAVDTNANMFARGPMTGTGPIQTVGTAVGIQMLWSSTYGLFQAGNLVSAMNTNNTGEGSVILGDATYARGPNATLISNGGSFSASSNDVVMGLNSGSNSYNATCIASHAYGNYSVGLFTGLPSGLYAFAICPYATATGNYATAVGNYTTANGYFSSVLGLRSTANGSYSMAFGYGSLTNANDSMAAGLGTSANSYACFDTGSYNLDLSEVGATPSLTAWAATDPIFEVGNGQGTGSIPTSTALVVYKNGDAAFAVAGSKVTAAHFVVTSPSGDIPAYAGNP